eukprot:gene24322-31645_t
MSEDTDGPLMRETFFKSTSDENKWVCILCIRAGVSKMRATYKVIKAKGYGNFYAHLNSEKHRGVWWQLLNDAKVEKDKSMRLLLASDDVDGEPRDSVTNTPTGQISAFLQNCSTLDFLRRSAAEKTFEIWTKNSLSAKSLKMWACLVGDKMYVRIAEVLPNLFGLIFDGWTADGTHDHYVAIIASFMRNSYQEKILLAFSSMNEEADLTANAHIQFIEDTLHHYGKNLDCVEFLSGDNCNTNIAISDRMENAFDTNV